MGMLQALKRRILELSPEQLAELRDWFAAFDSETWDGQFQADIRAAKPGEPVDTPPSKDDPRH
jgi:hypothetical protein